MPTVVVQFSSPAGHALYCTVALNASFSYSNEFYLHCQNICKLMMYVAVQSYSTGYVAYWLGRYVTMPTVAVQFSSPADHALYCMVALNAGYAY